MGARSRYNRVMATDDAPATKRDLAETKSELQEQMRNMQSELQEQMRDMQTGLLKAFLPWQESVHIQFEELKVNTRNSVQSVSERMYILERRLFEIEKKLLMNPPAA
jgi:hypothetical protein